MTQVSLALLPAGNITAQAAETSPSTSTAEKVSKPKELSATARSLNEKTSIKKAKPQTKTRATAASKGPLVPPPPPSVPSFLPSGPLDMQNSFSLDYMSLDDLKFKMTSLSKQLDSLKEDLADQKNAAAEKTRRAASFVSLYEEGVVSRKELSNEQKEAARAKRDLESDELKVFEMERLLEKICKRTNVLEKRQTKPKSTRSKPSSKK